MVWVKSNVNGNVFEVVDDSLVEQLEAAGHEVFDADPRGLKPKVAKKSE